MGRRWRALDIRTKFNFVLVAFLLPAVTAMSLVAYYFQKELIWEESRTKAWIVLREASATRRYVEDVLRPRMYSLIGTDQFILEAMSTTFVSTRIQERFAQQMPGYTYRRIATRPRNPSNAPDDLEKETLFWFNEDKDMTVWSGEVTRNRERVFFVAEPVVVFQECLRCHGKPEDSPKELREKYGEHSGFGYQVGEIMGLNSVSVPVQATIAKVRTATLVIALASAVGFGAIFLVVNRIFNLLVAHRLGFLTRLSERLVDTQPVRESAADSPGGDEIEALQKHMDFLARHVRTLRSSYGLGPKFVGKYVVEYPQFPGFVSWLYRARHSATGASASLKIPFPSLVDNPYYYHAFVNELHMLEHLHHPNVIGVQHREQDFLVMEAIQGITLKERLEQRGRLSADEIRPLFRQLCDVMGHLHTQGVVHHNLASTNMVITSEEMLKLIDFGLAWDSNLVDPIKEAGAGLQGSVETIAPEQIRGVRGDPRSDIYAMGSLLYTALTGEMPFTIHPSGERLGLKLLVSPTPPRVYAPSISPQLEAVVLKSLEGDPDARYQWVEDLCKAFEEAFEDRQP
ncbi:MAG: DUF3365 domain-containing protein [Thermodesulfobacteriota bacterium]